MKWTHLFAKEIENFGYNLITASYYEKSVFDDISLKKTLSFTWRIFEETKNILVVYQKHFGKLVETTKFKFFWFLVCH